MGKYIGKLYLDFGAEVYIEDGKVYVAMSKDEAISIAKEILHHYRVSFMDENRGED